MTDDPNLTLDQEIVISTLRGESRASAAAMLTHVAAVMRDRAGYLAENGMKQWDGEPTVLLIAPSHDVFRFTECVVQAELLARMGRKTGIHLRLVDGIKPLDFGGPQKHWALESFGGSRMLRDFAAEMFSVTYEYVTPLQLTEMAEGDIAPTGSAYAKVAAIRGQILQVVKMSAGATPDQIADQVPGTTFQVTGMILCLLHEGILVAGDDGRLYDVADAVGLKKVTGR